MRENGICSLGTDMVEATRFGLMEVFMKATGVTTKRMVEEDLSMLT